MEAGSVAISQHHKQGNDHEFGLIVIQLLLLS